MNVLSRKLFRNNDARKALAEIGGIMASSAPLMDEVQKFTGGGETFTTPDDLSDFIRRIFEANKYESRFISRRGGGDILKAYFNNELDPERHRPLILQLKEAEKVFGRDQLREAASQITNPYGRTPSDVEFAARGDLPGDQNTFFSNPTMTQEEAMANRRRLAGNLEPEVDPLLAEAKAILATDNVTQMLADRMNLGVMEYINTLDPEVIIGNAENVMKTRANEGNITENVFDPNLSLSAQGVSPSDIVMTPEQRAKEDAKLVGNIGIGDAKLDVFPNDSSSLEQPVVPVDTPFQDLRNIDPKIAAELGLNEGQLAMVKQGIGTDTYTPPTLPEGKFSDVAGYLGGAASDIVSELNPMTMPDSLKEESRPEKKMLSPKELAEDAAIAEATTRDLIGPTSAKAMLKAAANENPKEGADILKKKFFTVMGGKDEPSRAGLLIGGKDSSVKKKEPKSEKSRLESKYAELAELFGYKKDKKADMYELMAMIGFAMAAGESPSALKNIADAFLVGAQIKREDSKDDEEFDQKLKLLAFESLEDERAADRALETKLAAERRSVQNQLELFTEKAKIKEQLDPTSLASKYLGSQEGDAVFSIYLNAMKDDVGTIKQKSQNFIEIVGEVRANEFFNITGFPSGGSIIGKPDPGNDRDAMKEKLFGKSG